MTEKTEKKQDSDRPMLRLTRAQLEPLRDALRARGQRPSVVMTGPVNSAELIDALNLVEEWGAFVEAMYLMMAVDRRVKNVEREVLRGALLMLSDDRVRTRHMEAMLDAASKRVARDGQETRTDAVIAALAENEARAESALVIAAAVAAADDRVVPEEHALLLRMARGFGIEEARVDRMLAEMRGK